MSEHALQFGAERGLAGIVTEPVRADARSALLLVTAGLLPKSGPYRLYAELSRRVARDGVVSLRFDLSGIGDSAPHSGGLSLRARTELEIGSAIELVSERYAPERIVLCGLCSGAEDSLRSAAGDPRVTGVVMIDPFAYRTSGWFVRHLLHRGARRALRAFGAYEPFTAGGPRAVSYRYMQRPEAKDALSKLIARGARAHFVYTAGARERFNHANQLAAWFPDLELTRCVTLDHFPRLDHTQVFADDRRTLIEAIAQRLNAWATAPG